MALKTRSDYFGLETGIDTKEIIATSRLVSRLMGIGVPPNKAIVGANAFAHSSGIHQDGVLKSRNTFEIMEPRDVGLEDTEIVLTARSGRHALRHRIEELGYNLTPNDIEQAYERFLELADKKKEIFDEDLIEIVGGKSDEESLFYQLDYLHTVSGTGTVPTATVKLKIGNEVIQKSAWGDGPVDATYAALREASKSEAKVDGFSIRAVTSGSQALGEVTVHLSLAGQIVRGRGVSTDVIEASAQAYVDALNRLT